MTSRMIKSGYSIRSSSLERGKKETLSLSDLIDCQVLNSLVSRILSFSIRRYHSQATCGLLEERLSICRDTVGIYFIKASWANFLIILLCIYFFKMFFRTHGPIEYN